MKTKFVFFDCDSVLITKDFFSFVNLASGISTELDQKWLVKNLFNVEDLIQ